MTPSANEHGRILAECYQILRQAAARANQTCETADGQSAVTRATEVRGADARSSTT